MLITSLSHAQQAHPQSHPHTSHSLLALRYTKGQTTPLGQKLVSFTIPQLWQQLKFTSSYDQRVQDIVAFNQANRYARMCA